MTRPLSLLVPFLVVSCSALPPRHSPDTLKTLEEHEAICVQIVGTFGTDAPAYEDLKTEIGLLKVFQGVQRMRNGNFAMVSRIKGVIELLEKQGDGRRNLGKWSPTMVKLSQANVTYQFTKAREVENLRPGKEIQE